VTSVSDNENRFVLLTSYYNWVQCSIGVWTHTPIWNSVQLKICDSQVPVVFYVTETCGQWCMYGVSIFSRVTTALCRNWCLDGLHAHKR